MGLIKLLYTGDYFIFLLIIIALVFSLCVHEFSHGYIAYIYGDDTAYKNGRLTLNPLNHLDPVGSMMLLFIGFGYAKPVPVNPLNLNNPQKDIIKVAAAGPISNFILSFLGILFYSIMVKLGFFKESYYLFFQYFIYINTMLGLFNLIPIYPLDGGQIFGTLISKYNRNIFLKLNDYGPKILMFCILLSFITNGRISIFHYIIEKPAELILKFFTSFINILLFFL